jgi:hypothetical protein
MMKSSWIKYGSLPLLLLIGGCGASQTVGQSPQEAAEQPPQVITLTQTGCQFLETESQNYQYQTTRKQDCETINENTLIDRQSGFKPLQLKSGTYIFRVTNQNVPYELGFYLRGTEVSQATLPKVSGGGLTKGTTKDYKITLKPGQYVFSCPLNSTPDYPLVVQ